VLFEDVSIRSSTHPHWAAATAAAECGGRVWHHRHNIYAAAS